MARKSEFISTGNGYWVQSATGALTQVITQDGTVTGVTGTGVATWDSLYDLDSGIVIDSDTLTFAGTHETNDVVTFTNATGTGDVIQITNSGTGNDIQGTGNTWKVSKIGTGTFVILTTPAITAAGNLAINATGAGTIGIASTSTGAVTVGSTLVVTGAGGSAVGTFTNGDLVVSDGSLTMTDSDNASSVALTNNTITTADLIAVTSTSLTTGNGLLMTANGLTSGNMLSLVTTASGLTSGTFINCNDGSARFAVKADGATTISTGVNSTVALTVTGIQTSDSAVKFTTSGVTADDKAILLINSSGNSASGSNQIRIAPSGTPVEGSIGIEFVGASKLMQAMNIDGDSVANSVVAINGGGALTDGLAVLALTNDGNLATGGNVLNITMGGTPHANAIAAEIVAAKDAQALVVTSSAATNHAVDITCAGAIANDKAALSIIASGTPANTGSNVLRVAFTGTATNKPIIAELVGTGKDVGGLYSVTDNTTTHAVSIAGAGALATGGAMLKVTNTGTPAANTDTVANITFGGTATNNPIVLKVDNGTANALPLYVNSNVASATRQSAVIVQDSTTGAIEPLLLQQDDTDQAIMKFAVATPGAGTTVTTDDKSAGTAVYIKVMINDVAYWIKANPGA
jgi:hypothetical protein